MALEVVGSFFGIAPNVSWLCEGWELELQMFNTTQKMIEEQKLNNSTETAILPMQCYVQPFFRLLHKDCFLAIREIESISRMPNRITKAEYSTNALLAFKPMLVAGLGFKERFLNN